MGQIVSAQGASPSSLPVRALGTAGIRVGLVGTALD